VLNEHATIPADFDLSSYWEQSSSAFRLNVPNYTATFLVAPEVWPRLRFAGRFARVTETDETDGRGWKKAIVGFDVEEMACEYAVSFGPKLEVIAPATLREKVIRMAQATLESYTKHDSKH
jgi:predicted DNA-binding transcriptional regulator YafY